MFSFFRYHRYSTFKNTCAIGLLYFLLDRVLSLLLSKALSRHSVDTQDHTSLKYTTGGVPG